MSVLEPDRAETKTPYSEREWIGILACAGIYLLLRFWHLRLYVLNDKFDEGVYLSLMQGVASGKGALYRDYILCHPPCVIWAGAWLWPRVHGSLTTLRVFYVLFCGLAFVPMYGIARRLYGVKPTLLTLFLMAASPGFANWLGREIFLDPPLNVPLYVALWMLICLPRQRTAVAVGAGTLVGLGYLLKETALPAGLCLAFALWLADRRQTAENALAPDRPTPNPLPKGKGPIPGAASSAPTTGEGREILPDELSARGRSSEEKPSRAWLWFLAAFAVVSGLMLALLMRLPNYLQYTFFMNAQDTFSWKLRLYELQNGFFALPLPLTFGVAGVLWMARRGRSADERFLGLFALAMALMMFLLPKRFYWRYLFSVLPLCCLGVAVWWQQFQEKPRAPVMRRAVYTLLVLFGLVHAASLILYHTQEAPQPMAFRAAVPWLQACPDPVFTLNPLWSAASGHPLLPKTQNLIKASIHLPVSADEYAAALTECPTVLLEKETLRWLPDSVVQDIRARYAMSYRAGNPGDKFYVEVLIRRP